MHDIVILIAITTLKIVFLYGAMQEGEILFFLQRFFIWCLRAVPVSWEHYLSKPLYSCLFCMSGIWGLFFLWCPMPLWLEIILAIAGVNYLLSAAIGYLHEEKEAAEQEKETDFEKRIAELEDLMWPLGKYRE